MQINSHAAEARYSTVSLDDPINLDAIQRSLGIGEGSLMQPEGLTSMLNMTSMPAKVVSLADLARYRQISTFLEIVSLHTMPVIIAIYPGYVAVTGYMSISFSSSSSS